MGDDLLKRSARLVVGADEGFKSEEGPEIIKSLT